VKSIIQSFQSIGVGDERREDAHPVHLPVPRLGVGWFDVLLQTGGLVPPGVHPPAERSRLRVPHALDSHRHHAVETERLRELVRGY
jgi:hypothetical protein